jgi:hypothetical protein
LINIVVSANEKSVASLNVEIVFLFNKLIEKNQEFVIEENVYLQNRDVMSTGFPAWLRYSRWFVLRDFKLPFSGMYGPVFT